MARNPGAGGRESLALSFDPAQALPKKRSLTIAGHRTSITLEDAFWRELQRAAADRDVSVSALVSAIDSVRGAASLSAAIRVFLAANLRHRPSAD